MDKPEELRAQLTTLREEISTLSETETLTEEQVTRFDAALVEYKALEDRTVAAETRAARIADVKQSATRWGDGQDIPQQINRQNPFDGDVRSMTRQEVRSRAMRVVEERGKNLSDRQKTDLEQLMQKNSPDTQGAEIARNLLLTENDHYREAFRKGMTQDHPAWTVDEVNAINEYRVANETTTTAGGFGVPVLIDPTIILTSGAVSAPLLGISRIITITTNQWKGVASAGFTWAFQAESAVVADNTPTLAQPTIPAYAARGFIPYTIEVEQDYPGFQGEMAKLLSQGYVNLLAIKTMTGTGTNEPTGIFAGMQTGSGAPTHITCQTAGTVGAVDVRKAWAALPERFRPNATYVMSIAAENNIRAWSASAGGATGLALSDYTVNMAADGTSVLTGRPVILSDYAAPWTGATTAASALVVGDFDNFVIVQRAGMTVELVPHLFDTGTGRPIGQRGWFGFARVGCDAQTYNAFRLISNT